MVCDYCGIREATLSDRTVVNNGVAEYRFCKECYVSILRSGVSPFEAMQEKNARKGKECPSCGWTARDFARTFTFGCPDCYRNMREVALAAADATQASLRHTGSRPEGGARD